MRIVVALGGNALGNTPEEQKQLVKETVKPLADLIDSGHEVIITHGNGPQVGMIFSAFQTASETDSHLPEMPFPECGAMSQGYIGYHLQNALRTELLNRNLKPNVATIVTQVEVSIDDPAFQNPTKPIGAFYSEKEARILEETQNYVMKEDAGRGYRRVVPSPKPQETCVPIELSCAIGDEIIDDRPYAEIVEIAREFINDIGGFEKFAEWGLV
jgi:carbamate kinase